MQKTAQPLRDAVDFDAYDWLQSQAPHYLSAIEAITVSVDLQRGDRFYGQRTDCDPATVAFQMPVELCCHRFGAGEGIVNSFWKLGRAPGG